MRAVNEAVRAASDAAANAEVLRLKTQNVLRSPGALVLPTHVKTLIADQAGTVATLSRLVADQALMIRDLSAIVEGAGDGR